MPTASGVNSRFSPVHSAGVISFFWDGTCANCPAWSRLWRTSFPGPEWFWQASQVLCWTCAVVMKIVILAKLHLLHIFLQAFGGPCAWQVLQHHVGTVGRRIAGWNIGVLTILVSEWPISRHYTRLRPNPEIRKGKSLNMLRLPRIPVWNVDSEYKLKSIMKQ